MACGSRLRDRSPRVATFWLVTLVMAFLVAAWAPLVVAKIGLTPDRIDLGKVDPGHTSTHTTTITNTDTTPLNIQARAACSCPLYVTIAPQDFTLQPGASQDVTMTIDVPEDADPGIHDNRVTYTEVADAGVGGTAQGALAQNVVFYVRTAKLFVSAIDQADPAEGPTAFIRFVNAYADDLSVTVTGTVQGPGGSQPIDPISFTATGSADRSRSHQTSIPLPIDSDEPGTYTLTLQAAWQASGATPAGSHAATPEIFVQGEPVRLDDFQATVTTDGIRFSGRLVHVGAEALDAFMEVQIQEIGHPDAITLVSDATRLEPGASEGASILWADATGGAYQAVGVAGYRFVGVETTHRGTASAPVSVEGPSQSPAETDEGLAGGEQQARPSLFGGLPQGVVMALVGVGAAAVGGVFVWFLTRRR